MGKTNSINTPSLMQTKCKHPKVLEKAIRCFYFCCPPSDFSSLHGRFSTRFELHHGETVAEEKEQVFATEEHPKE